MSFADQSKILMFAGPDLQPPPPPPLQPVCWSAELDCSSELLQHPGRTIGKKNSSAAMKFYSQLSSSEVNSAGLSGSNWTSAWCRFQAANKRRPVQQRGTAGSTHPRHVGEPLGGSRFTACFTDVNELWKYAQKNTLRSNTSQYFSTGHVNNDNIHLHLTFSVFLSWFNCYQSRQ